MIRIIILTTMDKKYFVSKYFSNIIHNERDIFLMHISDFLYSVLILVQKHLNYFYFLL